MLRHSIVYKHTPHTSELQFALTFTVYLTYVTVIERKLRLKWVVIRAK